MNKTTQNISEQEKEGLKFLERDFNQCFQQMRHYDSQIVEILKFLFTAYTALIGISIGFYQFGMEENKDLSLPVIFALSVGLLIGIFMFLFIVRNRVYFVQMTRYINTQRGFFLQYRPLGFEYLSKMYANHVQPPYFNWRSSQTLLYCIIAALNSTLFGILLFIVSALSVYKWGIVTIGSLALFIIQLVVAISYLESRENKTASRAVFGKE
jgi:hypothetical protein